MRFFVDAVRTGRVLGIDARATPEEATSALGVDYAENQFYEDAMWRDFGVVEVAWMRASATDPWQGHHISIQTHRLGGDETCWSSSIRVRVRAFSSPPRPAPRASMGAMSTRSS